MNVFMNMTRLLLKKKSTNLPLMDLSHEYLLMKHIQLMFWIPEKYWMISTLFFFFYI